MSHQKPSFPPSDQPTKKRKHQHSNNEDGMQDDRVPDDNFDYDDVNEDDIMIGEFDFSGNSKEKDAFKQMGHEHMNIGQSHTSSSSSAKTEAQQADDAMEDDNEQQHTVQPYIPKQKGEYRVEELDFSNSAYTCLHRFTAPWPIPSFSYVYSEYDSVDVPHRLLVLCGNQLADENGNLPSVQGSKKIKQRYQVHAWNLFHLHQTEYDSDDDETNPVPIKDKEVPPAFEIEEAYLPNSSGDQNRVRVMPYGKKCTDAHNKPVIAAFYCDSGKVLIVDISEAFSRVVNRAHIPKKGKKPMNLLYTSPDVSEGWGLDWSTVKIGRLASGGQDGTIRVYDFDPHTKHTTEVCTLSGHTDSVEDIQWSPSEEHVLASCSCDGTIRIWDIRSKQQQLMWKCSNTDVNVIAWNPTDQTQIASGDDNGVIRVWNLEEIYKTAVKLGTPALENPKPSEHFDFHKNAITSIEWHPSDASTVVATSEDDTCTIWDFGIEAEEAQADVPPQLLFVHMGLEYVKEAHWHHKIENCVLVCGENALHMFRPSNL